MLTSIALTPSAPVLVPQLAGTAAAEVAGFRDACLAAAGTLPDRWIAVGVGPSDTVIEPECRGTFAGYGADVPVALSPDAGPGPRELPLCALFAAWLRGQVNPQARVQVRVCASDLDPGAALARGRALRAEIDSTDESIGLLVVADGVNTLTQSAPGGYDPATAAVQAALDDALAGGNADGLGQLPDGVLGRAAYQVLAGSSPGPVAATEILRGAPFGVGYFIGTWTPPMSMFT